MLVFLLRLVATSQDEAILKDYKRLLAQPDSANIRRHLTTLTKNPTRLAGSTGEAAAFDYLEGELRALGARSIERQPFKVSIPDPTSKGLVRVGGREFTVWPLWPNMIQASTCDVQGRLIYGGDGSMEALRGKDIEGALVVLELRSVGRWRNAAKLGAKAILFLEPDEFPRAEAEAKFSASPISIPRFYVPLKEANQILSACFKNELASLKCRQDWIESTSYNLVGEIAGTSASETITLSAFVDSMSVVPALAPGAESASGAAVLLELARVYTKESHKRTLKIVFSGAHALALQGSREWVQSQIDKAAPPTLLNLTLDLSSGSRTLASYARGWFYEYRDETQQAMKTMSRLFRVHAERLATLIEVSPPRLVLIDAVNNGDSRTWKNNVPGKFALDCEPMVNSGMNALTFLTIEDSRTRVDTPSDTLEHVDVSNLKRQAQTLTVLLFHALNDSSEQGYASDFRIPLVPQSPAAMRLVGGFATASGNVVAYDPKKSFIPDTPVPDTLAIAFAKQKTFMGVRGDIIRHAQGPRAEYRLIGLAPLTAYPPEAQSPSSIGAYRIDKATGTIDYAPSLGEVGDEKYKIVFPLKSGIRSSPIVVFPCVTIGMYDLVDPQDLRALRWARVFDAIGGGRPRDYGMTEPPRDTRLNPEIEDAQTLFLMPGQKYVLLGGSDKGETRLILTNTPDVGEEGKGYDAPRKGAMRFRNLALTTARDIAKLNRNRLARFKKYRIVSPFITGLQSGIEEEIKAAEAAEARKDWPEFDRHSRAAWALGLRSHPIIQKTANDVVNGVVFYLFLLMPFSYFLERLLVGSQNMTKQLGWSGGFFFGSFALLRLIHPAFEIVTNPTMIFVAFIMGALSLVVISFVLSKFESSMRLVKQAQTGRTDVDMRRSSVAMAAFNLGVSNLRRRKARTVLTTLTLVVMTFIVLSFTSIVPDVTLSEYPSDTAARYSGLLVRNPGLEPLQLTTYRQIANEFSGRATVVRRATYFGADIGDSSILSLQRGDRVAEIRAIAGFDPDENKVLKLDQAILPGGRWFGPNDRESILIPQSVAEQLRIDPREVGKVSVRFSGVDYKVIGIVDPGILKGIVDLDGDPSMPADFSLTRKLHTETNSSNQAFRSYLRLDPASCFIVPTDTALQMGADLRSLAVAFSDPVETRKALDSLMPRLRLNLYASVQDPTTNALQVKMFSVLQGSKGIGIGLVIIQMLIAAVFVLNTMVATVFERTKEIGIFSAIGLAPNHIAMLFFAESLVYGVLGAVLGYFLAQISARIIVATGAMPDLILNFSSTGAVLAAVLVMTTVLLSTIYPARKATQIAAPAINEEAFQTEPEGDVWEIPLPFSISLHEAQPVVNYLADWMRAYEGYTLGEFVTADTSVSEMDGVYSVSTTCWLAPYDLGVSQHLILTIFESQVKGVASLKLVLTRESGDPENWVTVNHRFLGSLRGQFLAWRTVVSVTHAA